MYTDIIVGIKNAPITIVDRAIKSAPENDRFEKAEYDPLLSVGIMLACSAFRIGE